MATKTRDEQLYDIGQSVGVTYDVNAWKNFAVKPEQVERLWIALRDSGILNPPVVPPPPVQSAMAIKSAQLGPKYEDYMHPPGERRPRLWTEPDRPGIVPGNRCDPFQVALNNTQRPDNDYWASSGQVAYVPDGTIPNDPGVDRVQGLAYVDHGFAIKPRPDGSKTRLGPESHLQHFTIAPGKIVAAVRNQAMLSNDALAVFDNGVIGGLGTATDGVAIPIKVAQLPATKKPTAIALTTSNEFALITVVDTVSGKGQVAVVALEGKFLDWAGHTWPHLGLPNQGSWSDFKILGYIDLPFNAPDQIAAASNGFWGGTSTTVITLPDGSQKGLDLGQIDITQSNFRYSLREGDYGWRKIVADRGYALVSSKTENIAAVIDLKALFIYFKDAWLSDTKQSITLIGRQTGALPSTLSNFTALQLKVDRTIPLTKPTAVLAGQLIDRWSPDFHKAYIAQESGQVVIMDMSSYMARWTFEINRPWSIVGSVQVGRNPISMAFARFNPWRLMQLIPKNKDGEFIPDPLNNLFYVCCRGDRRIDAVETMGGAARVYMTLQDDRADDLVSVAVCDRNNLVYACDFTGKKVCTFRLWELEDRQDPWQNPKPPRILLPVKPASDGSVIADYYECPVAGNPWHFQTSNVN